MKLPAHRLAVPSALSVAIVLSGCGPAPSGGSAKKYAGPEQAVAKVVDELGKAVRVGDAKKVCAEILAPQLAAKITSTQKKPCDKGLAKMMATGDDSAFTVDDVTLSGDRATASVHVGSGKDRQQARFELVKLRDRWQIASLGS